MNVSIYNQVLDPMDRWEKRRKRRLQKHLVASVKETHKKDLEEELRKQRVFDLDLTRTDLIASLKTYLFCLEECSRPENIGSNPIIQAKINSALKEHYNLIYSE